MHRLLHHRLLEVCVECFSLEVPVEYAHLRVKHRFLFIFSLRLKEPQVLWRLSQGLVDDFFSFRVSFLVLALEVVSVLCEHPVVGLLFDHQV